jgi:hypothetical protein
MHEGASVVSACAKLSSSAAYSCAISAIIFASFTRASRPSRMTTCPSIIEKSTPAPRSP